MKEDEQALIKESNKAWRELSEWWNNDINDGDIFHRYLIFPHMLALANCHPRKKILDFGCGNGTFSRRLFALGADVFGVDLSETFIESAIKSSDPAIQYKILDATSKSELEAISQLEKFDTIICSMVLHDLPTIDPLLESLPKLLKKNGSFVFSIPHPCFNMGDVNLNFFSDPPNISRSRYIENQHLKMKSKKNQPIYQHCFHRSISTIFQKFFSAGMVLDALSEPTISEITEDLSKVDLDWKFLPEIPPALICRWIFNAREEAGK